MVTIGGEDLRPNAFSLFPCPVRGKVDASRRGIEEPPEVAGSYFGPMQRGDEAVVGSDFGPIPRGDEYQRSQKALGRL